MAIKRQGRFYSQQRLSVPAIRDIESAVSADFDSVLRDMVAGTTTAYLLKGFKINIGASTFSQSADNLTVNTTNAAILHTLATESGTLLKITGNSAEALNSTNSRVSGAFIAGSTNYVSIDFVRKADTSTDTVYFFDKNSNTEFSKLLPVSTILDYKIVINTTGFTSMVPVCIVTTNSGNVPTQITDSRNILFRLGTGGSTPDQFNSFAWSSGRTEPGVVTTSSATNPFTGADKELNTFKDWMDAVMTSLKEIKGTSYWFSAASGSSGALSLATVNDDANLMVMTGDGTFYHNISVTGQLISNSSVYVRNILTDATVTIESFTKSLNDGDVLFLNLTRYSNISGNVTIAPTGTLPGALVGQNALVVQAGTVGQFSSLTNGSVYGDWIKSRNDNARYFRKVISFYNSAGSVTNSANATYILLDSAYNIAGSTTGSQQIHYNQGYYGQSAVLSSSKVGILNSYGTQNVFWLAERTGSNLFLRNSGRLVLGETRPVYENTSNNVLNYIGASSESLTYPVYASSIAGSVTSPSQVNYGGASTDDLTVRTSLLTTAAANHAQNKNIKLVGGGTVANSSALITWSTTATVLIGGPGSGTFNTIAAGSCNLSGTNDTAYVSIDRNSTSVITVSVTSSNNLPLAENIFVIARKLSSSNDVWVGVGGQSYLISDGSNSLSGFAPTSSASLGFGNLHKWRQRAVTGTMDGVNTSFTYTTTRPAYSVTAVLLFKNGLFQTQGSPTGYDYSLTNTTNIVFTTPPSPGDEIVVVYAEGNTIPYVYAQSVTTISVTGTTSAFSPSCSYTPGVAVFVNGLQRVVGTDFGATGSGVSFSFNLEPGDVVSCFYTGVNDSEISKQVIANESATSGRTIYTFDLEIAHVNGSLLSIDGVAQFPINNTYGLTSSNITVTDYRFLTPGAILELATSSLTTGSVVYLWTR